MCVIDECVDVCRCVMDLCVGEMWCCVKSGGCCVWGMLLDGIGMRVWDEARARCFFMLRDDVCLCWRSVSVGWSFWCVKGWRCLLWREWMNARRGAVTATRAKTTRRMR